MLSLRFNRVTLWRRTQEELTYDLKRLILHAIERRYRSPSRRRTITDVAFSVLRGEKFGIIGANGSGKSTLLKLAAGILQPTSGAIEVHGSLAGLIELGAGFDGELTVTENIIYYGVLLGFRRHEMRLRLPSILDFAELHDYAQMPLKALSSGMTARLSFAVATEVRPDILLIDEVFAVGDEAFREKSLARMQSLWNAHSTIIMVSHDLQSIVQNCDRVLWLDGGSVRAIGPATDVVRDYLQEVQSAAHSRHLSSDLPVSPEQALGNIDQVVTHGDHLSVSGWTMLRDGVRGVRVAVCFDGRFFADATYGLPRPDVHASYPHAAASHCGFHLNASTEVLSTGDHHIDCAVYDDRDGRFHLIGESRTVTVAGETSIDGIR